jgi:hypothetical protein
LARPVFKSSIPQYLPKLRIGIGIICMSHLLSFHSSLPLISPSAMLPDAYRALALKRSSTRWNGYKQPEDFGYDFSEWVSPYTKGAHVMGHFALVLQDWSSEDTLKAGVNPDVQELGRTRNLRTNIRLEKLLYSVLGISFEETYATNIFPFIKPGGISASIPKRDVLQAARTFARLELEIVNPTHILALGKVPSIVLHEIGVNCTCLPHPAHRGYSFEDHQRIWDRLLGSRSSV